MTFDDHRNPDGTYNGVTLFASLTGLSEEEIRWTINRTKALHREGKSKEEIKAALCVEASRKPWEVR